MAPGERFRGTGSSGVAEFLAEHQSCDAGFDVTRERGPGSGRLKIACKGCGRSVEYNAAEAAAMASGPAIDNGETPAMWPTSSVTARPDSGQLSSGSRTVPPQPSRSVARLRMPSWLPSLLIAALILGGLGLIVAGLLRSGDDSGSRPESTAPGEPSQEAAAPPSASASPSSLRRRIFFDRFAIGIPRGWHRGIPGGNLALVAPGGAARLRVFSENPAVDPSELVGPTAQFLAEEHPGAKVSTPEPIRFGGRRAIQIRAAFDGGEERAAVISAAGFSFLVTYLQRDGAEDSVVEAGEASYASFRPR